MTTAIQSSNTKARCVQWPPDVIDTTHLGYLRDQSGNKFTRDIGRSTQFSDGKVYFVFGDTFAHNSEGNFVGCTDNTIALLIDQINPTLSAYKSSEPQTSKNLYSENKLPAFVRAFEDEKDTDKIYHKFWSFAGIVNYEHNEKARAEYGYTYFEKSTFNMETGANDYEYTGIAQTIYDYGAKSPGIAAVRKELALKERPLFTKDEPRIGSFAAVADGPYIYAYGHIDGGIFEKNIGVGRVESHLAEQRHCYEFWNGNSWSKDIKSLHPIFHHMQHGQIFKTRMFGAKYPWAFVGCRANADSRVVIGRGQSLQGPFDTESLMDALPLLSPLRGTVFTYNMYPHPWAFEESKGDLMISWSEGTMQGNVVAVKVRFRTQAGEAEAPEAVTKEAVKVIEKADEGKKSKGRKNSFINRMSRLMKQEN